MTGVMVSVVTGVKVLSVVAGVMVLSVVKHYNGFPADREERK